MSMNMAALLLGLLVAPAWLVWVGHGLRQKSVRTHTLFWWAVIGNAVAIIVTCIALFAPPLMWRDATMRAFTIHWALLLGTIIGAAIGALVPRPRR